MMQEYLLYKLCRSTGYETVMVGVRGMTDNEAAIRVCKPQDETSSRVVY